MVDRGQQMLHVLLGRVEPHLKDNAFLAGSTICIADLTAWFTLGMANAFKIDIASQYPNWHRWYQAFAARDSVRQLA